jgi:1-acyl-sn-glycerol-3-phosphate acyltransferase
MKKIIQLIFWIIGWKIDERTPEGIKKCVIVVGPHTSNWDFVLGRMAFVTYGVKGRYLIKKELFFPPLGWFLKAIGGVPVDRKQRNNLTETAARFFNENETMFLVFSPEGTRSYNPKWKKGFYYIAMKANVPICISYMDYKRKIGGFHSIFYPTGKVEEDILYIKSILREYKGKYPEKGID